MPKAEWCINSD